MDCELGEDYQLESDSGPEAHEEAAASPSWSERHPTLSGLVGTAALVALVLAMVYAFGGGAAVGGLFRLVAVALLSVARDALEVHWWVWALFAAALVLSKYERASNERWNVTRDLLESNCALLSQVRDELRNHRTGS